MRMHRNSRKNADDEHRNTNTTENTKHHNTTELLSKLERLLRRGIPVTKQRQLRYEDAIGWFVDQRPPADIASRGVIIRTQRRDGRIEVVQAFLDNSDQLVADKHGVPYGRRLVTDSLDDELTEAFGDTSLLIVE